MLRNTRYHHPMQCNIDRTGRRVRLIIGTLSLLLGVVLVTAAGNRDPHRHVAMDRRRRRDPHGRLRDLRGQCRLVRDAGSGGEDAGVATLPSNKKVRALATLPILRILERV